MLNYREQQIPCCDTCKWEYEDEDGVRSCLIGEIKEIDMKGYGVFETFLSLEFVNCLGICNLWVKT